MPFQKGNKLAKGRAKGSINKRTQHAADVLAKHNFDPIEALMEGCIEARTMYKGYKDEAGPNSLPFDSDAHIYLRLYIDSAKDLAGYIYPKLKMIEQVKSNALEGMTLEQKIDMFKQGLKALEAQKLLDGPTNTGHVDAGNIKDSSAS